MPALSHSCQQREANLASRRDRLIMEHMPQVRLIARRIQERLPQHISLDDLVSAGTLGLISAIDHFNPSHNVKLKTYAEYKIRGAILDSLREMDWVPRQRRKKARQIETAIAAAEKKLHRPPTEEETAAELNVSLQEYHAWLVQVRGMNLERLRHVEGDDSRAAIEAVPDSEERLPSRAVERKELRRLLGELMARMPEIERRVLRLYYQEGMTLRQIAEMAHVHESRISQLKTQALLRLRKRVGRYWPTPRGR